ncbi:MAG: radical SAM protein [Ignavibacteriales bacterium]|nr:radical SAM protein [Ignavibacteriales bacterium]
MKTPHVLKKAVKNAIKAVKLERMLFFPDILITHHCTQRCLQCSIPLNASPTKPFMKFEHFKTIVDRLDDHGTQGFVISGGEPILHPELPEFIQYAASKKFARVHLLSTLYGPDRLIERAVGAAIDAGISLSVSFDGLGEVGDTVRGARDVAERVKKSIEYVESEMKRKGKRIHTGVGVVLSQLNIHQTKDLLEFLEKVGWLTEVDVYRWQSQSQMENDSMKFHDTKELREALELVKESPVVLTPPWLLDLIAEFLDGRAEKWCPYIEMPTFATKVFIHPDGSVKTCMGDVFGNLLEQTPEELFASKEWDHQMAEKHACAGCVNTCFTRGKVLYPTTMKEVRANWKQIWNLS